MNKVLILFAHPRFEKSKTNRALLAGIDRMEGVTLNDLYEEYPDFNIDVEREKKLLADHDVIVWHFPLYMYSSPALFKQWMDAVLEYGWAHGSGAGALRDKVAFVTLTAGGARASYAAGQLNRHALGDYLIPFEQTALLCKMIYLPPFAVCGTHRLSDREVGEYVSSYRLLLKKALHDDIDVKEASSFEYLNDWLAAGGGTISP